MPNKERLLLVEGQDDRHFVKQFWDKHYEGNGSKPLFYKGKKRPFDIETLEGIENLCKSIPTQITTSDREVLGILADANSDLLKRWKMISCKIKEAVELSGESKQLQINPNDIPDAPEPTGTIINSKPRIGIWLMPCNKLPGELEDFAVTMVPRDDPIWPSSRQYITDIPQQNRKFDEKKSQRLSCSPGLQQGNPLDAWGQRSALAI